ncbi:MAG: DinB family protein [Cyclobacteriaceae bacterium]|nr:DinB family protein [Cyclobacteriaceae bacterium]
MKYLIFGLILSSALMLKAQHMEFSRAFLPMWDRACKYTLEVAESMPAEAYQYKPTSEINTFSEHMDHIARNLYMLNSRYVLEKEQENKTAQKKEKEEVIAGLKSAFDYVRSTLMVMTDEELKEEVLFFSGDSFKKDRIFYLMKDHMTHHRGQAIIYLRLNGIKPPAYRGW